MQLIQKTWLNWVSICDYILSTSVIRKLCVSILQDLIFNKPQVPENIMDVENLVMDVKSVCEVMQIYDSQV